MGNALLLFPLLLLVTAVFVAERPAVQKAIQAYFVQGLLLALYLALSAANSGEHEVYGMAATILVAKGFILPWLLLRASRQTGGEEAVAPRSGSTGTVAAAVVGLIGFAAGQWGLGGLLSGLHGVTGTHAIVPFGLGAALAVIAVSLWTVFAHRDTFKVALGICLLENGAHLLLAAFAWTIPEIASIGVVIDVILAIWLVLYVGRRAEESTGARSDSVLDQLRG